MHGLWQDSFIAAQKMGIDVRKRWVATKDMRTRHEHGMADGQVVPAKDPFIVGGEELMFPADTAGSPWNVYNCRCAMRTVEKPGIEAEPRQIRVRDPVTGKNVVVSDMTYSEWLKWKEGQEKEAGIGKSTENSKKNIGMMKTATASKEKDDKALKNEQNRNILKEKIEKGEISTKVSVQQHAKHVAGTPQYEKYKADRIAKGKTPQSTLSITTEEAQAIIDKYAGTGMVKISGGKITEYITTENVIGQCYQDGAYHDTKRAEIFYSKRSAHIVPVKVKEDNNG